LTTRNIRTKCSTSRNKTLISWNKKIKKKCL